MLDAGIVIIVFLGMGLIIPIISLLVTDFFEGSLTIGGIIFGTLCLVFAVVLSVGIASAPIETGEAEYWNTTSLYALDSGSGVHGKFIRGTGNVDDVQYYIGYTKLGDESYKQVKFDAGNSLLILNDTEIPRAEMYVQNRSKSFWFIFTNEDSVYSNKLYIPRDGLSSTFEVN